jgi:hypothetical protein
MFTSLARYMVSERPSVGLRSSYRNVFVRPVTQQIRDR